MLATPASAERAQKSVFNFEISFSKKAANLPHPPLRQIVFANSSYFVVR